MSLKVSTLYWTAMSVVLSWYHLQSFRNVQPIQLVCSDVVVLLIGSSLFQCTPFAHVAGVVNLSIMHASHWPCSTHRHKQAGIQSECTLPCLPGGFLDSSIRVLQRTTLAEMIMGSANIHSYLNCGGMQVHSVNRGQSSRQDSTGRHS